MECARRNLYVATFVAAPVVAGVGIFVTERSADALGAGMSGFYTLE